MFYLFLKRWLCSWDIDAPTYEQISTEKQKKDT